MRGRPSNSPFSDGLLGLPSRQLLGQRAQLGQCRSVAVGRVERVQCLVVVEGSHSLGVGSRAGQVQDAKDLAGVVVVDMLLPI